MCKDDLVTYTDALNEYGYVAMLLQEFKDCNHDNDHFTTQPLLTNQSLRTIINGAVKVGFGESVSLVEINGCVKYGLYKTFIYINENASKRNNLKESDILNFFDTICKMDYMESNGTMRNGKCRGLFVLRYKKGAKFDCHTYVDKLINIKIKDGIEIPCNINDFEIAINETLLDIIKNGKNKGKLEFYNHLTAGRL